MKFSNKPTHVLKSDDEIAKKLFQPDKRLNHLPTIPEFYADQEIFVTGGSGFMGKVLLEKLLRSCSELKTIYVLIRPKKGKTIEERLVEITESPLFGLVRKNIPQMLNKLIPINGDVTELGLGLSPDDIIRMKNVSIIFHSAASVRFDDPLKYAVFMNTRGTREMMRFAEKLTNLKVFLHVSTTYTNLKEHNVREEIYPEVADWQKTIQMCEKLDEDTLDIMTQHYSDFMANTYVFTKNLAEHVIDDYKHKVPVVLFRPSIVISTMTEPFPGWTDNFNGPIGLLVGCGCGIIRTMHCDPNVVSDFAPVDIAIKGMIVAAWKRAHEPQGALTVYNCASSGLLTTRWGQITDIGIGLAEEIPMDNMLWPPGGAPNKCRVWNFIMTIFTHLLPAILIDFVLTLKGHKPFLARIHRKVFEANSALIVFIHNEWHFVNENFLDLNNYIKADDIQKFGYDSFMNFDIITYLRYAIMGVKKYLMKDNMDNLPHKRVVYKRFIFAINILHFLVYTFAFYLVFFRYDFVQVCRNYFSG